jgi:type VI secretion system secreted protein VgrG
LPDIFSLAAGALPPGAHVVGFYGIEGISRPYQLEVGLLLPAAADVDMTAVVGTRATLVVDRGFGQPEVRHHGVLGAFELLHELGPKALYRATIVPEVWQLGHTMHSRVFTDGAIPDILAAVLRASGFLPSAYSFRLASSYPAREHVCQYRESDLAFISRLMEREGLYYFFEQGESREVLVVTDHRSFHGPLHDAPIAFHPVPGVDVTAAEALSHFTCKVTSLPALVKLKDYDYEKPSLDVSGSAPIVPYGRGEIVSYGENFVTRAEGQRLAAIRAEEVSCRKAVYAGRGQAFYVRSGHLFTLDEHPRPSLNGDYLAVEVEHFGNQSAGSSVVKALLGLDHDEVYRMAVTAIPAATQFRAERRTPAPRISSVVDAVVDGAGEGAYAPIDEHGRYRVRMFFDESDLLDGSASTWVRMLQPHGGSPEGFHFPLRKGTEVHLVFLGGDPDRPVIVGVGPNAEKPSLVQAQNHTKNVVQTGGQNRIELEDLTGGQFITMSSPFLLSSLHLGAGAYNLVAKTAGSGLVQIGANYDTEVGGDMSVDVTGSVTQKLHATYDLDLAGAATQNLQATLDLTIAGAVTATLESTLDVSVTGAVTEKLDATLDVAVAGATTEKLGSTLDLAVSGAVTAELGATLDLTVAGAVTEKHGATWDQQVSGAVSQTYGASQTTDVAGAVTLTTPSWTLNAAGSAHVNTPDWSVSSPKWFDVSAHKGSVTGLNIDVTGINVSANGLTTSVNAVSLSANGMSATATGASFSATGVSASVTGLNLTQSAPNIVIAAIVILM